MIPKWVSKNEGISGVAPLGAALVAQTDFFMAKKYATSAPKVLSTIEKSIKNVTKELPDCEKDFQKSSLFGAKPPSHGG